MLIPHPGLCGPRWDVSALFISHEPAKPPSQHPAQLPSRAPTRQSQPTTRALSSFPAAACPIDDWSFEPHPSSLRSSLSSLSLRLSFPLPAHKSPIPQGGSLASGPQAPLPTNLPRHFHTTVRTSVCQRRDGGKRVSRTSSRLTWACLARPHRGNHKQTSDPCPTTTGLVDSTRLSSEGGGVGRRRHADCLSALDPPPPVFSKVVFPRLARLHS